MVTSLANFRSDYTIVQIPDGNFLEIKEQLYANINLLRMGCSGRSALTLEELRQVVLILCNAFIIDNTPSDTTKERFIAAYHLPEKTNITSPIIFRATVIELIKLLQAGLAVCGMFDLAKEERNGLLCDKTCDGLQRWITEIGEPCMRLEVRLSHYDRFRLLTFILAHGKSSRPNARLRVAEYYPHHAQPPSCNGPCA